jgi:hypothetical protein
VGVQSLQCPGGLRYYCCCCCCSGQRCSADLQEATSCRNDGRRAPLLRQCCYWVEPCLARSNLTCTGKHILTFISLPSFSHLTPALTLRASHCHLALTPLASRSHLALTFISFSSHFHPTLVSLFTLFAFGYTIYMCLNTLLTPCAFFWIHYFLNLHYLNTWFTLFTWFAYTIYTIWAQSYLIRASIFGYLK